MSILNVLRPYLRSVENIVKPLQPASRIYFVKRISYDWLNNYLVSIAGGCISFHNLTDLLLKIFCAQICTVFAEMT